MVVSIIGYLFNVLLLVVLGLCFFLYGWFLGSWVDDRGELWKKIFGFAIFAMVLIMGSLVISAYWR